METAIRLYAVNDIVLSVSVFIDHGILTEMSMRFSASQCKSVRKEYLNSVLELNPLGLVLHRKK